MSNNILSTVNYSEWGVPNENVIVLTAYCSDRSSLTGLHFADDLFRDCFGNPSTHGLPPFFRSLSQALVLFMGYRSSQMNSRKSSNRKILYGCVALLSIVILCCIVCIIWLYVSSRSLRENIYCNTDNELYRYMRENAIQWTEIFPPMSQEATPSYIDFIINRGQNFRVYAGYWLTWDNSPIFYVVTNSAWRDRNNSLFNLGRKGLFYTPTGALPIYGMDEIEELGEGIYCYSVN